MKMKNSVALRRYSVSGMHFYFKKWNNMVEYQDEVPVEPETRRQENGRLYHRDILNG